MRLIVPACLLAVLAAGCAQDPCGWGDGDNTVPTESHLAMYGDAVVVVDAPVLGMSYYLDPDREANPYRHAAAVVREVVYLDSRLADSVGEDLPVAGSAVAISFCDRCPPAASRVGGDGDSLVLFLTWTGRNPSDAVRSPWFVGAEFVLDPDRSMHYGGRRTSGSSTTTMPSPE